MANTPKKAERKSPIVAWGLPQPVEGSTEEYWTRHTQGLVVQRGKEEKSEVALLSSREIQVLSTPPHGREESSKSCLGLGLFFPVGCDTRISSWLVTRGECGVESGSDHRSGWF